MDEAEREEKEEEEEQDKIDMFSLMEELQFSIETQVHCVRTYLGSDFWAFNPPLPHSPLSLLVSWNFFFKFSIVIFNFSLYQIVILLFLL